MIDNYDYEIEKMYHPENYSDESFDYKKYMKRQPETIDIGNGDEIDVVDVNKPDKRWEDKFKGEPR